MLILQTCCRALAGAALAARRFVRDSVRDSVRDFARGDAGVTFAEYGLLIAVVALVALGGAKCMGAAVSGRLTAASATVAKP